MWLFEAFGTIPDPYNDTQVFLSEFPGWTEYEYLTFDVKKKKWLQLNPAMYEFLCKHKVFVEKVNYFEWARYLEKINDGENTIHLLTKLDESAKRQNLNPFRQVLYNEFESRRCFYCGKPLNIDNTHVDHCRGPLSKMISCGILLSHVLNVMSGRRISYLLCLI